MSEKDYIFEHMRTGRPKVYKSEAERLEVRRVKQLKYIGEKNGKVVYYGKKHVINDKDGFTIKIETLNRLCINVVDMEWCITVLYVEDQALFTELRKSTQKAINAWFETQIDWDHKNWIFVWENPDYKPKGGYIPQYQHLTFQLYLKRVTDVKVWQETLKELIPLTSFLKDEIKNTCREVGIVIKYKDNPANYRHLAKLSKDKATSAAEPQSC